ncbi:MAG: hypothetical protein AB7I79_06245 [Rhizobiaceae bacterium]
MIRLALALSLIAFPAAAETMSFFIANGMPHDVAVELHGERRVWPGDDQVYLIGRGEKKSVPIECSPGERICYGAWKLGDDRVSFGVGPDGSFVCDDCCSICVGSTISDIRLGTMD